MMTDKQKELIRLMAGTYDKLAEECTEDENFHAIMTDNNKLYPYSLDEMGCAWSGIVDED